MRAQEQLGRVWRIALVDRDQAVRKSLKRPVQVGTRARRRAWVSVTCCCRLASRAWPRARTLGELLFALGGGERLLARRGGSVDLLLHLGGKRAGLILGRGDARVQRIDGLRPGDPAETRHRERTRREGADEPHADAAARA